MTPDIYLLQNMTYVSQKKQVVAEFACGQKKFSKRYSFFPFAYLPAKKEIISILLGFPKNRVSFSVQENGSIEVIGSCFDDLLEALNRVFANGFGGFVVLDPKRQFLLQKGWGFFDFFRMENGSPEKLEDFSQGLLSGALEHFFAEDFFSLKEHSEEESFGFMEKICLSNLACIHPSEIKKTSERTLLFFQNWFFKNRLWQEANVVFRKPVPVKKKQGPVFFDFSGTLNELLCFPFQNTGPDALDCKCCKPESIYSQNVSLASGVLVEFLVNGFYFESKDSFFSKNFHEKKPFREQRIKHQVEWCLSETPVGPFFSGQKQVVPLADAKSLGKNARIIGEAELHWFCMKKESFVSIELKKLAFLARLAEKQVALAETQNISSSGVLFFKHLSSSFGFHYFSCFSKTIAGVLQETPLAILENPALFGEPVCAHLSCLKSVVFSDFLDFAGKNGFFGGKTSNAGILLECSRGLSLADFFSKSFGVSRPMIFL